MEDVMPLIKLLFNLFIGLSYYRFIVSAYLTNATTKEGTTATILRPSAKTIGRRVADLMSAAAEGLRPMAVAAP